MRLMIRVRSPTRLSLSRLGRLASSSSSVGIATIRQCPRSLRSQPRKPRLSIAVSNRSVFARRCSRDTATLVEWMTCTSIPRACSHRASQKPSRPASKASAIRSIILPALTASSRQRSTSRSSASGSGPKFFQGLAVNAGRHSSHKPARLAHFNDNYQSGVLIKGDERAAQVINLGHAEPPSLSSSDDDARPPARPIASPSRCCFDNDHLGTLMPLSVHPNNPIQCDHRADIPAVRIRFQRTRTLGPAAIFVPRLLSDRSDLSRSASDSAGSWRDSIALR